MTSTHKRSPPPKEVAPVKPNINAQSKSSENNPFSLFSISKQYQTIIKKPRKRLKMPPMQDTMRVIVRFRPINEDERRRNKSKQHPKHMNMNIINKEPTHELKIQEIRKGSFGSVRKFSFNDILPSNTSQYETFRRVAEQSCNDLLQGYNSSILVYGQTTSGKTHTMYGPENRVKNTIEEIGIIPQSFAYIFETLDNPCSEICYGKIKHKVQCQFIEIYGKQLKDLLDPMAHPSIDEYADSNGVTRALLKRVQVVEVNNVQESMRYIQKAKNNRTTAGRGQNITSARSHMILRVIVSIETAHCRRTGVANFVDLASSEPMQTDKRHTAVLDSIQTLQRVVSALAQGNSAPFMDSKLTFFLKNSLGGNCRTTMLITVSPHICNRTETIQSLMFGENCSSVQSRAVVNEIRTRGQLIIDNETLVQELLKLRKNKIKVKDIFADAYKAIENENAELKSQIEALSMVNKNINRQLNKTTQKKIALEERELKMTSDQLNMEYDMKNVQIKLKTHVENEKQLEVKLEKLVIEKKELKIKYKAMVDDKNMFSEENETMVIELERWKERNAQQMEKNSKLVHEQKGMADKMTQIRMQMLSELEQNQNKMSVEVQKTSSLDKAILSMTEELENYDLKIKSLNMEMQEKCEIVDEFQIKVHALEDEQRKITLQLESERANIIQFTLETDQQKKENEKLKMQVNEKAFFGQKLMEDKNEMQIEFDIKETQFIDKIQAIELKFEKQSNELQRKNAEYFALQTKYSMKLKEISEENALLQSEKIRASEVEQHMQVEMHELKGLFKKHVDEQVMKEEEIIAKQLMEDERIAQEFQQKFDAEHQQIIFNAKKKRKKKKKKKINQGNDDYKENVHLRSAVVEEDEMNIVSASSDEEFVIMDNVVNDENELQMDHQSKMLIKQIEDENNRVILRRQQMEEQAKRDALYARNIFSKMRKKKNYKQDVNVNESGVNEALNYSSDDDIPYVM